MSLYDELHERLTAHRSHDDAAEALGMVGFLFEKASGREESAVWDPEVRSTPIDEVEIKKLRSALIHYVTSRPDDPCVGRAYWALGKLMDMSLKEIFVRGLAEQLERPEKLFQIMCVLAPMGEDVFGGRTSVSYDEHELNTASARAYLARAGLLP